MEQLLWSIGGFIVALGLVVTFHEFGHFWVARRCGVKVQVFSVGFGKPLWTWRGKDETRYQVAAVPLGGYVKMLDHEVDPVTDEEVQHSFRAKSVGQRMAIVVAGPVANFIFAVLALWVMLMIGMPAVKPVVGEVEEGSIAASAGLAPEMEITAVDGRRVNDWQDINLALVRRIGDAQTRIQVTAPEGGTEELTLDLSGWQFDPDRESTIASLGMNVFQPAIHTTLAYVMENSPAEDAGLQVGDKILSPDGTQSWEWEQIRDFIAARPGETFSLWIERNGATQEVTVTAGAEEGQGYIGVAPDTEPYPEEYLFTLQYGPWGALTGGIERTWNLMGLTFSMLGKLVTGDIGVNTLSGPVGIAQGAGSHASYGLVYFLSFLALISVSLGILNLLPIPMLDGGHLLFYALEWVRGKPVPQHIQELSFRVGLMLLLTLMAITLFNDISRLTP